MATQDRDDGGRYGEKMRDQDILKAFDFETTVDDPYQTVSEVATALDEHWDIDVTDEAVRRRLEQMTGAGTVEKRQFGPGVAYRATVSPRLSDEVSDAVDDAADELASGESTSHVDLWNRLDE